MSNTGHLVSIALQNRANATLVTSKHKVITFFSVACEAERDRQAVHLLVWYRFLPSGEATRPLKVSPPCSFFCARPAIGVLQDPSRVPKKARSHWIAILVSSWLREANSFCVAESLSRQAMPMAPCIAWHRLQLHFT